VLKDDRERISYLEQRLSPERSTKAGPDAAELEMLADLYMQSDSYLPALETIDRLLSLPALRRLAPERRLALEAKAVACRLARGEAQAAVTQARELLRDAPAAPDALRAGLLFDCARGEFDLGRIEEAAATATRALEIADRIGDQSKSASALMLLGNAAYRKGELAVARDFAEQALGLFRRLGDEARVAHARNNIGLIHKQLCEWDSALASFRSVLETQRRLGHYADTAPPLMNLGIVHQKMGEWAAAEEHYRAFESVLLQIGNELLLARASIGLGNVARLQRRFPEAETHLLAALDRARRKAANRDEVLALEFLGELDFDRGRPERAMTRYHEALALAERSAPEGDLIVEIERRRAEALIALNRLDEAERALDRATRLARLTDDKLEHAIAYRVAGELAVARGRRLDARQAWEQAAKLLSACRERYESGRVQLLLARSTDDARTARTHALRACSLFAEVGSTHWQEQAEAELARLMGPAPVTAPTRSDSLLGKRHRAPGLVAASNAMRTVETLARRAAATELSVLITGETGTGKELVARTIHSQSPRAARPFLAVNCGALRADLALSQLFGHRKGAFTGAHAEGVGLVEAAHGGTLFLDEAGELPLDVQVTLLRFLESGEYLRLGETQVRRADVRIIAATNRVLRGGDAERLFRRDLLYRLNEIEIRLPALRERVDDIVPLARHFLSFYGGLEGPRLSHDGESLLVSYGWPGNVRELENVMKRLAALHSDSGELDARAILPLLADPPPRSSEQADRRASERDEIVTAWRQAHGNKSRLADLLGVSRKTLYARLKRLDLKL
jgi:DNA-binding NtrC family response regulator